MNVVAWIAGLFIVYLLLNEQLATFISLATTDASQGNKGSGGLPSLPALPALGSNFTGAN